MPRMPRRKVDHVARGGGGYLKVKRKIKGRHRRESTSRSSVFFFLMFCVLKHSRVELELFCKNKIGKLLVF